jgi:hypothetical protein
LSVDREPPSYRQRLRCEGLTLAVSGALGSALLLATQAEAPKGVLSTAVQLAVVVVLLLWLGPRSVHRAIAGAERCFSMDLGTGEPTALWQLPLIVAALTLLIGRFGGWDAGLRVTAGCILVGLAQAYLLERIVAVNEATSRRRYFRIEGSRILRGTRLGYIDD